MGGQPVVYFGKELFCAICHLFPFSANQLGDEGVELVRDSMEAVGKLNALASFR